MSSLNEKNLPIGSIIEAKKTQLMICGYNLNNKPIQNHDYDYICCIYPNGVGTNSYLIKKSEIENVLFLGFRDNRFIELNEKMGAKK